MKKKYRISEHEYQDRLQRTLKSAFNTHVALPPRTDVRLFGGVFRPY
jgi:hypothetical protein